MTIYKQRPRWNWKIWPWTAKIFEEPEDLGDVVEHTSDYWVRHEKRFRDGEAEVFDEITKLELELVTLEYLGTKYQVWGRVRPGDNGKGYRDFARYKVTVRGPMVAVGRFLRFIEYIDLIE